MSIKKMADRLEKLEEKAGDEGWGGDFREDMFGEMIRWAQEPRKYSSLSLLLAHLIAYGRGGRDMNERGCPPDYNGGFCADYDVDCNACWEQWGQEHKAEEGET